MKTKARQKKYIFSIPFTFLFVALIFFGIPSSVGAKENAAPAIQKKRPGKKEIYALPLEELLKLKITVVSASKREERLSEAPGVVSVITAKDIETFGANDLNDLLQRLPNVFKFGSAVLRDNVTSIRAQTSTHIDNHVLILINGRPTRESHINGHNGAIYRGIPLEIIKRIEVIRGPGSVLYGTSAFSGVINIITWDAEDLRKNSITPGRGSNNTFFLSGIVNKQANDLSVVFSAKLFDSAGWKFQMVDPNGVKDSSDYSEKEYGFFTQLRYKDFTITGFSGNQFDTTTSITATFPTLDQVQHNRRHFLDFEYKLMLWEEWKPKINITYNDFTLGSPRRTKFYYNDILFEPSINGVIFDRIYLTGGVVYQHLTGELQNGAVTYSNDRFSLYTQADYSPWNFLKLIAGIQLNKPEGIDVDPSPRFAAIMKFTDDIGMKFLYAKAFRSALAAEQAIDAPVLQGNPNVNPETINTFDVQLFYEVQNFFTALTYYNSKQKDTIIRGLGSTGVTTFLNGGDVDYQGIELESKASISKNWEVTGSVSYQENEDDMGNDDVGLTPNFMAKGGVSYHIESGLSLGLFNSYFSKAAKLEGAAEVNPPADSYNWMTLKGSLELSKFIVRHDIPDIKLNLFIDNLLDKDTYFPELLSRTSASTPDINTAPSHSGIAIYGSVTIMF